MTESTVQRLRNGVVEPLKRRFVGRDEVVDLIALATVAGEHLFLFGPPGTAKSAAPAGSFPLPFRAVSFDVLLTQLL